jgi:hypothetical protein
MVSVYFLVLATFIWCWLVVGLQRSMASSPRATWFGCAPQASTSRYWPSTQHFVPATQRHWQATQRHWQATQRHWQATQRHWQATQRQSDGWFKGSSDGGGSRTTSILGLVRAKHLRGHVGWRGEVTERVAWVEARGVQTRGLSIASAYQYIRWVGDCHPHIGNIAHLG